MSIVNARFVGEAVGLMREQRLKLDMFVVPVF